MSYANLAGLPYVFGLYGAFVPCIVYAFLGTSRQLVRSLTSAPDSHVSVTASRQNALLLSLIPRRPAPPACSPHCCRAFSSIPFNPQVVGPVAVTSILLGNGLSDFMPTEADPNNPVDPQVQENYNHAAIQIAFIAGCFYTAFGVFRMGKRDRCCCWFYCLKALPLLLLLQCAAVRAGDAARNNAAAGLACVCLPASELLRACAATV